MTSAPLKARVLYIVYWGALEPLGQSLVVPAILRMANLGVAFTLVTFEKPADLEREEAVRALRTSFESAEVRWHPLRYHKTPKWPATAFDSLVAVFTALRLRMVGGFDVVHARTFVAGPIGWVVSRILGSRFIYHNEGFYPDEQVDGGVWSRGSLVHRLAKQVETFLYDHADGMVALSQRAQEVLRARRRVRERRVPVVVVPSAVDPQLFYPAVKVTGGRGALRLVYLGSVGFRYRLDAAGRFVVALRRIAPGSILTVVSRAEASLVESMLDASGLPRSAWTLKSLPHSAVPAELRNHDAGLFFLTEGLSEHGCSPTKVGEYWASGLPVVTTRNVSDIDAIVRSDRVGIVTSGWDSAALDAAARDLLQLLHDEGLPSRCRKAAVDTYALEPACERQLRLYTEVMSRELTSTDNRTSPD